MKGNYTCHVFFSLISVVRGNPHMKGNYTFNASVCVVILVRDHPQIKGDYTLQAPALAVLTGPKPSQNEMEIHRPLSLPAS